MKKILVVTTVHSFDDNRILFKEIETLKKLNYQITYAAQYSQKFVKLSDGIKIYPLPIVNTKFKRLFSPQRKLYIYILHENFDFIHFHDPELILLMFLLKKKINVKIIFDIHENISGSIRDKDWIPKIFRNIISKTYSKVEKYLVREFDSLIVAEKSYRKIYGDNVVEVLNYPIPLPEIKKSYEQINFVYAGDISEIRGIWQMLDIVETIYKVKNNIHFDLVGRFISDDLESAVRKFLVDKKMESIVEIYGRVSINKVNEILMKSNIGFSLLKPTPNYIESLPTKIFDYMNNKVVVIASDFPLYREYIDKINSGITINFNTYGQSIDRIIELIESPNNLDEMANNGYRKILDEWNWYNEEKKMISVYG